MKKSLCCVLLGLSFHVWSQSTLVSVSFDTGWPVGWTQQPAGTWSLEGTFDAPGNCIVTEVVDSFSTTAACISPTVDLSAYTSYSISFKLAVTKNNFMSPELTLGYTTGQGTQSLAVWSEWMSPTATYTINSSADFTYPLEAQHVLWQLCSHTVQSIGAGPGSFVFRADLVNGGWALLDSLKIVAIPVNTLNTGVQPTSGDIEELRFENPCNSQLTIKLPATGNLRVFTLWGQELRRTAGIQDEQVYVDLRDMPRGVYIVSAPGSSGQLLQKKLIVE